MRQFIAALIFLVLLSAIWLGDQYSLSNEPVWGGHSLSQWLDAYRTNLSFPDETPPRSGFSDEEIGWALNGIGDRAFPFMLNWLTIKHDYNWRWTVDAWLFRTGLSRYFHNVPEAQNWQGRATDGFMFYNTNAQQLLPALVKLTHSSDEDVRLCAYESAFSTRPSKEVFLPLTDRVLREERPACQGFAAQWMAQRFPEEADKRSLRSRYPQLFMLQTQPAN